MSARPLPSGSGPFFIGSEIYRTSSYGANHPLSIPRVSTVMDLCRALDWLPDKRYLDSPVASVQQLIRFHDPAYIAALTAAEDDQAVSPEVQRRYNLGCNGNPVFTEMFRRPATACGGSILGAEMVAQGRVVYSPAGGTHHGRHDQASGFCYLNDPVLALLTLLDQGLERVCYLDVDAHHADGVQLALSGDSRLRLISIHEQGRWPMSRRPQGSQPGDSSDRGGGQAWNFAVPAGFNASELEYLLEAAVWPLLTEFAPQAMVLQCGADALADDPLSKLALPNTALWRVVAGAMAHAPRLLVLGGGGYNPWSVARCWTGVWATLNQAEIPERLPKEAEALLRALSWRHSRARSAPDHWFTTLRDPEGPGQGTLRDEIRILTGQALQRGAT